MLGNLFFGVPLGLSIVGFMTYLGVAGAPTMQAKLALLAVVVVFIAVYLGIASLAWPIITPFEATLWRCWNCSVELTHRFPLCPRCGAPSRAAPTRPPRVGQVIPSGSDESPTTSGSA